MKLVSRSRSFFSASSPAQSPGPAGRNRGAAEAASGRLGTGPVQRGEERDDIAGDEFGFLGGGEVPASRHDSPAADVIEPLGPFPWRFPLGDQRMGEDRDRGR